MTHRIFRYIPIACAAAWQALGWELSELGLPHGLYSLLGEWKGDGEPKEPH